MSEEARKELARKLDTVTYRASKNGLSSAEIIRELDKTKDYLEMWPDDGAFGVPPGVSEDDGCTLNLVHPLPAVKESSNGDGGVFRYLLMCMGLSFILGLYIGSGF